MIEYLFVGGPLDGKWRAVAGTLDSILVAISDPIAWTATMSPLGEYQPVTRYHRRLWRHPSWRILLTFYVHSDYDLRTPVPGPGLPPVGFRPEQCGLPR